MLTNWTLYRLSDGRLAIHDGDPVVPIMIQANGYRAASSGQMALAAIAPELLEACRLSLRNTESLIYQQPARMEDSVELKSLRTWRKQLELAIAKATGEYVLDETDDLGWEDRLDAGRACGEIE